MADNKTHVTPVLKLTFVLIFTTSCHILLNQSLFMSILYKVCWSLISINNDFNKLHEGIKLSSVTSLSSIFKNIFLLYLCVYKQYLKGLIQ